MGKNYKPKNNSANSQAFTKKCREKGLNIMYKYKFSLYICGSYTQRSIYIIHNRVYSLNI